jgi:site-specific DNA-methyltransferase (adenine-specific)
MKPRKVKSNDDWATPRDLYNRLNDEFDFNFDPCPLQSNTDGLGIEWKERNYINPPYSQKLKESFIRKALLESKKGRLCVMLLPVSTSTKIFHEVILPNADVRFIKGRVKFEGVDSRGRKVVNRCGTFDSMIVIFRPRCDMMDIIETHEELYTLKRQLSPEAFERATGNKCKDFVRNHHHNEVI